MASFFADSPAGATPRVSDPPPFPWAVGSRRKLPMSDNVVNEAKAQIGLRKLVSVTLFSGIGAFVNFRPLFLSHIIQNTIYEFVLELDPLQCGRPFNGFSQLLAGHRTNQFDGVL